MTISSRVGAHGFTDRVRGWLCVTQTAAYRVCVKMNWPGCALMVPVSSPPLPNRTSTKSHAPSSGLLDAWLFSAHEQSNTSDRPSAHMNDGVGFIDVFSVFVFFAQRPRSATPTGLTVDDHFNHENEILASPKPPTVGVAL